MAEIAWTKDEQLVKRGGFTLASYREEWPSKLYPGLWHGLVVLVEVHAAGGVVLDCHATLPDGQRTSVQHTAWLGSETAWSRSKDKTTRELFTIQEVARVLSLRDAAIVEAEAWLEKVPYAWRPLPE